MKKAEITLNQIRQKPQFVREARLSDLVSKEEVRQVHRNNIRGKRGRRQFDDVDALVAEMIARFGYDYYKDWNAGIIKTETTLKHIAAERARERGVWLPLESIVMNMVGSCIKRHKGEKAPKGPKVAQKIIKAELKAARGEM